MKSDKRHQKKQCDICCEVAYTTHLPGCMSCNYCWTCFVTWFNEQALFQKITHATPIKCPTYTCSNVLTTDQILLRIGKYPVEAQRLDLILLRNYLRNQEDITSCPNSQCSSYGFFTNRWCLQKYLCAACTTTWKPSEILLNPTSMVDRTKTFVYETLFLKKCPTCNALIYKTGGCSHMNCSKCKSSFCWTCKRLLNPNHGAWLCQLNIIYFTGMVAYMWLFFLTMTGMTGLIFYYITRLFSVGILWTASHLLILFPSCFIVCLIGLVANIIEYCQKFSLGSAKKKYNKGTIIICSIVGTITFSLSILTFGLTSWVIEITFSDVLEMLLLDVYIVLFGFSMAALFSLAMGVLLGLKQLYTQLSRNFKSQDHLKRSLKLR